jgi:hypothetical protein
VVILGLAKFLVNKQANLRLTLTETDEEVDVPATVVRFEAVEGRSDIAALALQFDVETIPMKYKLMISGFLNSSKARTLRNQDTQGQPEDGNEPS